MAGKRGSAIFGAVVIGAVTAVLTAAVGPVGATGFTASEPTTYIPAPQVGAAAYANRGVLNFGSASLFGSPTDATLAAPAVTMAATPSGQGYWLAAADGGIFSYGDAGFHGSAGGIDLYAPIVGMAPSADGAGYWLVAIDGGVFAFGDAQFYGSTGNIKLNEPIVGMAVTPDHNGYWLVASDGGIFAFGDAQFYGSTGNVKLAQPIVGMAPTNDGRGYWLVAADGGLFSFGDAPFYGSLGGKHVNGSVTGLAATKDGLGYWMANANGAVYDFGDAVTYGDNLGTTRTEPISTIVATPDGSGYWLLEPDAFPTAFSHPGGGGTIVAVAASQIHGDPDTGYFCNPYGPCEAWCALFATWVWAHAGIPIPSMAFVGNVDNWTAGHTASLVPTARPAPGDFVYYGTGPQTVSTAVHIGIVAQVWPDGAIDTIEGDAGPAVPGALNVVINGPFLPSDSRSYNGFPIFGYGVP